MLYLLDVLQKRKILVILPENVQLMIAIKETRNRNNLHFFGILRGSLSLIIHS